MLTNLCTYDDVVSRMADIGLASASEEDSDNTEIIERKRGQADKQITLDLTIKLQKVIMPFATDYYNNTPTELIGKLTAEGKEFLRECAVVYTIRGIYEEGEARMRFRFQDAGDTIEKILKRWDLLCVKKFEEICPLLTFDQDGSGTITLMERLLMQTFTSVRVTV